MLQRRSRAPKDRKAGVRRDALDYTVTSDCRRRVLVARLDQFAFVLVRPKSAGNIGSAARALKNMGLSDLRLVGPAASATSPAARAMAVHGSDVLGRARRCRRLADAIDDCALTVGTTCRTGPYRSEIHPLREAARELVALSESNRVAVIFGPEDTGLTNRELKLCQRLVTIPTAPAYPSLNLAQAVMLFGYELMMAADAARPMAGPELEYAPAVEVDAMVERMKQALIAIGFLPESNPEHIMFALRRIFGRTGLSRRDLDILNGIASQTRWVAQGGNLTLEAKRRAKKKLR
jgi:tRNA/rRNA methyltransferase